MIGKIGVAVAVGAVVVASLLSYRAFRRPDPAFPIPAAAPGIDAGGMSAAEIEADRRRNLALGRDEETGPIARWPATARREGDVLTLRIDGRDVARFTDTGYCDGFDQCGRWRFQGVWSLGGRTYPWLTLFHGEGEQMAYVVDASGRLVGALGTPSASPDGRWLVVAYDDPDTDGAVTVFEAGPSGLTLVAASDAACQAWDWTRDGRLTMTCTESDAKGQRLLAADLVRRGAGWRIEPGAELDRQTRRRLDRPSKPLVDVEVPAVADDGSEEETYEIEKGYRRLVPNPPIPTKVAIQAEGR